MTDQANNRLQAGLGALDHAVAHLQKLREELQCEYSIAACDDELDYIIDELEPAQFARLALLVDARRKREQQT